MKRIFISGGQRNDRTNLICTALGSALQVAGGYSYTDCICEDGSYKLLLSPAARLIDQSYPDCGAFLSLKDGACLHDTEVFRSSGVRLLSEAKLYPFAVVDGIAGFELILPQFRNALIELLNSDVPIIGTIARPEEVEAQRALLGLGQKLRTYYDALIKALAGNSETIILDFKNLDEDELRNLASKLGIL